MNIKALLISIAFLGMLSANVIAGGDHAHGHDSEGSRVGYPSDEVDEVKIIHVVTKDTMRYEFSPKPEVEEGDVVKFVVTNEGLVNHEFSIGNKSEQELHRKMMRKMPNMIHEDGNTVTVKPGETKVLTWKFSGNGGVVFACNIPGHFEAGMYHNMTIGQGEKMGHDLQKHDDMKYHH